jgi:hypothetical protein
VSVDVELRADLPARAESQGKRVTSGILGGVLAPCLRGDAGAVTLEGCAALLVGVLRSEAEKGSPASEQSLHVAAGPRVGVVVPLAGPLSLVLQADALVAFTRATLRVDGIDVWRTPLVSGLVGAALEVRFWSATAPAPSRRP